MLSLAILYDRLIKLLWKNSISCLNIKFDKEWGGGGGEETGCLPRHEEEGEARVKNFAQGTQRSHPKR